MYLRRVFYIPGVAGFLKHQQYQCVFWCLDDLIIICDLFKVHFRVVLMELDAREGKSAKVCLFRIELLKCDGQSVSDSLIFFVGFDLRLFFRNIYSIVLKGYLFGILYYSSLGSNLFWVFNSLRSHLNKGVVSCESFCCNQLLLPILGEQSGRTTWLGPGTGCRLTRMLWLNMYQLNKFLLNTKTRRLDNG